MLIYFSVSLLWAAWITITEKDVTGLFPRFLNISVLTISGYLSMNAGAVLGFTIKGPSLYFKNSSKWNPKNLIKNIFIDSEAIQIFACYFYVFGLLLALITYGIDGFSDNEKEYVPLIASFSTSFIGVIAGALGIALGQTKPDHANTTNVNNPVITE
ncbi:MAG: hypothetical protein IPP60_05995 [Sphingobacteriales bacterium]|nr:hypothetical protein [Sphingobacteriales bacterium]